MANEAHPVDLHVGTMLKKLRRRNAISQTVLATAVGVSFQQIQKYENAKNRISASRLYDLAQFLKVDIEIFFEGEA